MDIGRIARHLYTTRWSVAAAFPQRTLLAIEQAVRESHRNHAGQLRFAVEDALHSTELLRGVSARERAIAVFSQLRVWDTEYNNGVLIYLLLADRDVEIVADRGIAAKVGAREWEAVCREMEADFRQRRYETGSVRGIEKVAALLHTHFPSQCPPEKELPSTPVLL